MPEDVIARAAWDLTATHVTKLSGWSAKSSRRSRASAHESPGNFPSFDELARRAGSALRWARLLWGAGRSNHLAAIVADGNAIGGLFQLMFEAGLFVDVTALRADLVTTLNEAVENAITTAASGGRQECEVMPVIPHYGAGDDIFVSVPAVLAWKFCALLADAFCGGVRWRSRFCRGPGAASCDSGEMVARQHIAAIRRALANVSLGIGMCFAHASHPIGETHHHAERAMDVAKKRGGEGKLDRMGRPHGCGHRRA